MIHAIYRKGVFEPTTPVELPDECEVEFEPATVQTPANEPPLNDVYAILSERYRSGEQMLLSDTTNTGNERLLDEKSQVTTRNDDISSPLVACFQWLRRFLDTP